MANLQHRVFKLEQAAARTEERVFGLQRRLAAVEARLGIEAPAPEPEAEDAPASAPIEVVSKRPAPAPAPALEPEPVPIRTPEPPPPRPARKSLEVDVGRWILSRLGGLSLVLAAGFLFHYAATRGWLGPAMRILTGVLAGCGLVALGEWQNRKLKVFAASLTGTGLAILYVSVFAGHALYDFYPQAAALAFASLVTVGGVAQALRHRVEAVAGLAAAGGFLAPVLVLNLHAQPVAVLAYVLVLNLGLGVLRAKTGWKSTEILAWIGTPLVAALPLATAPLGTGLAFLLAYVALFGVRPHLQPTRFSALYTLALAATTAAASFALFRIHGTPHWALFAGGVAAVLLVAAWAGARRARVVAEADLAAAAGFAVLALLEGLEGWHVTGAWALLAAGLLLAPLPRLKGAARDAGAVVAILSVVHVAMVDAWQVENRMLAFVVAGAAVALIGSRGARWGGVLVASLGVAVEVATIRDANPWLTLTLLTEETLHPSTRLLACGTLALLPGVYAVARRNARAMLVCGSAFALLVLAEMLYLVEDTGRVPLGMVVAALLVIVWPRSRTIWAVAGALAVAVAADLFPPAGYVPFLNRRALGVGTVLAVGWLSLRGRPEGTAVALLAMLLGVAEIASMPDRAAGASPWSHLLLDLRTTAGIAPFVNTRFLFLAGAAATAFLAARRWPGFGVAGHVYVLAAVGAEVVGLVRPEMRADAWAIFRHPGANMGPHLALTGLILLYGAGLITVGVLRNAALTRRVGLGLLIGGGLKVSAVDLTALGDLYRVGSFLVLGATFLAGSYAYHRWLKPE